jgi:DNA-binding NtrC family response regulator
MEHKVLIVDDDPFIQQIVLPILVNKGCHYVLAKSEPAAMELLEKECFDLVITESIIQQTNGFAILEGAKKLNPELIVVVLTGYAHMASAIKAFRMGADDYILKRDAQEASERILQWLEYLEKKNTEQLSTVRSRKVDGGNIHDFINASPVIFSQISSLVETVELIAQGHYGRLNESLRTVLDDLYIRMWAVLETSDKYLSASPAVSEHSSLNKQNPETKQTSYRQH